MKAFQPALSVRLVKAIKRSEIIPGVKVAARYGDFAAIDLHHYMGESGGVQTTKSVREPAGGFTITLSDKRHSKALDTLYALIEPMDMVEIRFAHDPSSYKKGEELPVIMRGLVSSVTRPESIGQGKPDRSVTITGQDFGKILQILFIFYLNNSAVGDNVLHEFAFFHKYASADDAKNKSGNEFAQGVLDEVINPYLKRFSSFANGASVGAKVINEWSLKSSIDGAVSPYAVASFNNVSLHAMLCSLLDVGRFNEMFTEDTADGVTLVIRPNPFLDASGKPIQGIEPERISISDKEIVSHNVSRSDNGVANYFWVVNSRWFMMSNEEAQTAAQTGEKENYILDTYLNSQSAFYGIRKMEVETMLGPPDGTFSEAPKKEDIPDSTKHLSDWIDRRRKILADSNKDNVIFESGSIQVEGNERIKAGTLLVVTRANSLPYVFYVVKVSHSYLPFRGFITDLQVERGTGFIERSKAEKPQYQPEIDAKGVV